MPQRSVGGWIALAMTLGLAGAAAGQTTAASCRSCAPAVTFSAEQVRCVQEKLPALLAAQADPVILVPACPSITAAGAERSNDPVLVPSQRGARQPRDARPTTTSSVVVLSRRDLMCLADRLDAGAEAGGLQLDFRRECAP